MIPNVENLRVFSMVCLGLAIFLSLLLFVAEKVLKRKIKWGGFVVLAIAGYGLPIFGFASKYVDDRTAWRHEATTSGIAVAHDPPNHDQYEFEYVVAGQRHYSWHTGTAGCDPGEMK